MVKRLQHPRESFLGRKISNRNRSSQNEERDGSWKSSKARRVQVQSQSRSSEKYSRNRENNSLWKLKVNWEDYELKVYSWLLQTWKREAQEQRNNAKKRHQYSARDVWAIRVTWTSVTKVD